MSRTEKTYRLELKGYSIEGSRDQMVETLSNLSEREIYDCRLYGLKPKKVWIFNFIVKHRIDSDIFSHFLRSAHLKRVADNVQNQTA